MKMLLEGKEVALAVTSESHVVVAAKISISDLAVAFVCAAEGCGAEGKQEKLR